MGTTTVTAAAVCVIVTVLAVTILIIVNRQHLSTHIISIHISTANILNILREEVSKSEASVSIHYIP